MAERTREIGVRMALGATAGTVRRMVVASGAKVVAVGAFLGIGGAIAATRLLDTLLYEVSAVDPLVFTGMAVMMLAVGVLARFSPRWLMRNRLPG